MSGNFYIVKKDIHQNVSDTSGDNWLTFDVGDIFLHICKIYSVEWLDDNRGDFLLHPRYGLCILMYSDAQHNALNENWPGLDCFERLAK